MRMCWFGEYQTIRDLAATVAEAVRSLNLADYCTTRAISKDELEARREECERLVADGILDLVEAKLASLRENLTRCYPVESSEKTKACCGPRQHLFDSPFTHLAMKLRTDQS